MAVMLSEGERPSRNWGVQRASEPAAEIL